MDFHVIFTIGEYAFRRVFTGWLIRMLGAVAVLAIILMFMGGPEPDIALIEHRTEAFDLIFICVSFLIILMGATDIPRDISSRTVLLILSKPVEKFEFVLGKFVGLCYANIFATVSLCLIVSICYLFQYEAPDAETLALAKKYKQTELKGKNSVKVSSSSNSRKKPRVEIDTNPYAHMIQKTLFVFLRGLLVCAIVTLLSTQLNEIPIIFFSSFYIMLTLFIMYLPAIAKHIALPIIAKIILVGFYFCFANMRYFQLPPEIDNTGLVDWSHMGLAALYAIFYTAAVVLVSLGCFNKRDVAG